MNSFNELTLNPGLQRAVIELGYEKPTPIQAQALPILLGPATDFIGLAATGTGKTAAFSLPLLERISLTKKGVQGIVLCPTRELCMQVAGQINLLGKYLNIHALPIYGGAAYDEQLRGLKKGVPVVVGTPGRVIDHIQRGTLKLNTVTTVILDEADEMISMGFREDLETILETVPRENSKIWLFSATMSPAVSKVADEFLDKPQRVQVNRTEMLSSTVEQSFYMTHEKNKPEVLCKLIDAAENFYGIIFCQTKNLVNDLSGYLTERGYKVGSLQGDMSQAARESAMNAFRQRRTTVMVCTDVASRGLDVKDISHVINYSIPRELDNYVHRIGRTARSGKAGLAMSLVTPSHRHLVQKIERMTKSKLKEGEIPTRKVIGMKKIGSMLEKFNDQPGFARAVELMDASWKETVSNMTSQEVAARFLTMMFPYVFSEKERPQLARTEAVPRNEEKRYDSKQDRRDTKRRDKRDFKKKFSRGYNDNRKRSANSATSNGPSGTGRHAARGPHPAQPHGRHGHVKSHQA